MSNYVHNIAIVGAGGNQGKFIAEEFVKTGKHKVYAITRAGSKNVLPEGVEPKYVDYNDPASLVQGLTGQDVLIITMSVTAPPDTQDKLIEAAGAAGVKYIVPNGWGYDFERNAAFAAESLIGHMTLNARKKVEDVGKSKWINITCGFWYEFSLAGYEIRYGFDIPNRKFTVIDDGDVKIHTSTWVQVGRAAAALFSLKIAPEDENDKSPSLKDFENKSCRVKSFHVSQKDMFESLKRVTGTIDADWTISHEPSQERYLRAIEMMKSGDMRGFGMAMYTRGFYPDGGTTFPETHNAILGLPEEDLDDRTAAAIELAKNFPY
ncbi:hypothetical protein ABW19_dt0209249 [Dactylella cylindrospora]|nr:hypothetical protein ABW19_dt0209249 [Dactylella cylindrospora]